MISNYNDLLRKGISNLLESNQNNDSMDTVDFFYNLNEEHQEIIMRLAFLDLYKLNYYTYGNVSEIFKLPIDDLIDKCITDVGLAISVITSSKTFNDMDYVSKALLLELMEENDQDKNLCIISKSHILDKLTYVILDNIENYKEYYKEYLEVNKDKANRITTITEYLCFRIINLKYQDENKYKKYILEFVKGYYKWKNFIKNHEGKYLLNNQDIKYLEIINNYDVEEILDELDNNFDFLFTIVGEYFYYKTQKIEIKEEIIDTYFNNSTNEKVKEKLK